MAPMHTFSDNGSTHCTHYIRIIRNNVNEFYILCEPDSATFLYQFPGIPSICYYRRTVPVQIASISQWEHYETLLDGSSLQLLTYSMNKELSKSGFHHDNSDQFNIS